MARTKRPAGTVEQAADELYGLPLADFTSARDERARSLRQEGRRDEAEAVKKLRKPTPAAWSLNQLSRRRPHDIERLLAAGERMREAQAALLAGGDRSALRRASAEERDLVSELTRDATAVAGKGGGSGTSPIDERIRATLHAAALDGETAAALGAGRLVRDRQPVSAFGTGAQEPETAGKPASRRRRPDKRQQDLEAAKAGEQKASREHARATKASERARKRAADAETRAAEARERAQEARASLRDAQQRERAAATARDRAARAVTAAEKKLG